MFLALTLGAVSVLRGIVLALNERRFADLLGLTAPPPADAAGGDQATETPSSRNNVRFMSSPPP